MSDPWYQDGLRFGCTRCGRCCRGAGTVRVSEAELEALARRLDLSPDEFRPAFTRKLRGGERSLREKRNRDCIFYDRSSGCSVYPDRPRQCRTWPFWRGVVHSEERWDEEASSCPGMNRGRLHGVAEIVVLARDDGTSGQTPD